MRYFLFFTLWISGAAALSAQADSIVENRNKGRKLEYRIVTYVRDLQIIKTEGDAYRLEYHPVLRKTYWLGTQLEKEEVFRDDTVYAYWATHFFPLGRDTVRWENGKQVSSLLIRHNGALGSRWINGKKEGYWHEVPGKFLAHIQHFENDTLRESFDILQQDVNIRNFYCVLSLKKNDTINRLNYAFNPVRHRWMMDEKSKPDFLLAEESSKLDVAYDHDVHYLNDSVFGMREIALDESGRLRRCGMMTGVNAYSDTIFYPTGRVMLIRDPKGLHRSFYEDGRLKERWDNRVVYAFSEKGVQKKMAFQPGFSDAWVVVSVKNEKRKVTRADRKLTARFSDYYTMPFGWPDGNILQGCLSPKVDLEYQFPKSY